MPNPLAESAEARHEVSINQFGMKAGRAAQAVILAVAHQEYLRHGCPIIAGLLEGEQGIVLDVNTLDRAAKPAGIDPWWL